MTEIHSSYKTTTKSTNGLRKELIKKYKEAFEIKPACRIYDIVQPYSCFFDFYIEKPHRGKGSITYDLTEEKEVVYTFYYFCITDC